MADEGTYNFNYILNVTILWDHQHIQINIPITIEVNDDNNGLVIELGSHEELDINILSDTEFNPAPVEQNGYHNQLSIHIEQDTLFLVNYQYLIADKENSM